MSFKCGKRRLRRLPLSLAVTGVMSLWAACASAATGEAATLTTSDVQCDSDANECGEKSQVAGSRFAVGTLAGDVSLLGSGNFSGGPGIAITQPANVSGTTLIGDIAIGGANYAYGSGTDNFAISIGDSATATGGNVAFGDRANANNAAINGSIALGAYSLVDRSNALSIGSASQTRSIKNLAAGTVATDAVNVSQLTPVVNALGGTFNSDGSVTAPTFMVGGTTQPSLASAITALDTTNTNNSTAVTNLINNLSNGTIGLVKQSAAGAPITFAAGSNGNAVDFTSTAGTRTLKGVSVADISATSTDAVNGAQLFATNQQVGTNTGNITTITNTLSEITNGAAGIVLQNAGTQAISVASTNGGTTVDMTGTAGVRTLTGIAAGNLSTGSTDAVNGSQLYATQQQIGSLNTRMTTVAGGITDIQKELDGFAPSIGAGITYDDATKSSVTLGGANGTVLTNLAPGLIAAGSMQAINGDQMAQISALLEGQIGDLNDRTTDLENQFADVEKGIADGSIAPSFSGDAGGNPITNVAPGVADTDAANVGQMTQMVQDAVAQAQSYTDGQAAAFNSSLDNTRNEIDQRFKRQDERLDRIGAMSAASTHMAINAAGASSPRGRVAVGAGVQNGKGAAAVGYARPIGKRTQMSIGGSFSGPEKQAGVGLSVSL